MVKSDLMVRKDYARQGKVLQDLLQLIHSAVTASNDESRKKASMEAWGEYQFHRRGGGTCGICARFVRLEIPVTTLDECGKERVFSCLCNDCMMFVKSSAKKVVVGVGRATVEYQRSA